MLDLQPRQGGPFEESTVADPPQSIGGPGPIVPTSSSATPGVSTTLITLSDTTITLPLSTIPISSPSPSTSINPPPASTSSTPPPPSSSSTPPPPSSTPPTPSPAPALTFATPTNATTCAPLPISWTVALPAGTANLSSAHLQLVLADAANGTTTPTPLTTAPLLASTYTWPRITVPPGQYILRGLESDGTVQLQGQSAPFAVQAGADTSCVAQPAITGSTSKGMNKGAIAGGTVGGLLLLACAAVAFFFLCSSRRPSKRAPGHRRNEWGGLGSVDSKPGVVPRLRGGNANADTDSADRLRDAAAPVDSASSLEGEKFTSPAGSPGSEHALPVLGQHASWSSPGQSHELAPLPSRVTDSPRSSLEYSGTGDPFAGASAGAGASSASASARRASRTPRKPVPAYNPTPEEIGMDTRSGDSPAVPSSHSSHSSSQHGDPVLAHNHPLKNKTSEHFHEGQPVHYLIPDPPPPRRAHY